MESESRWRGYRAALDRAGVVQVPAFEAFGELSVAGGVWAARRLLPSPGRPTAVVDEADEMAFGVLLAASEPELEVPHARSVVGIDDHAMSFVLDLTTYTQPVRDLGEIAARHVVDALRTKQWVPEQVVLPVTQVLRSTTTSPEP